MMPGTYNYIYCHPTRAMQHIQIPQSQHQVSVEARIDVEFISHNGYNWPPFWMNIDPITGLLTVSFCYYIERPERPIHGLLLVKGTRCARKTWSDAGAQGVQPQY
jgi:hypothetical protein